MSLLIAGILVWIVIHLMKRVAPGLRDTMGNRFGNGARGVIAVLLIIGLLLMILGYRGADFTPVYDPPSWGVHVNNLLMVIAVVLMGMGNSKGRLRSLLRHPMLTGVIVWAAAHLLVNGDLASIILFGSMASWAIVEILVINATSGPWVRPEPGPAKGDIKLFIISAVVFVVIVGIHTMVGPSPFPMPS